MANNQDTEIATVQSVLNSMLASIDFLIKEYGDNIESLIDRVSEDASSRETLSVIINNVRRRYDLLKDLVSNRRDFEQYSELVVVPDMINTGHDAITFDFENKGDG